MGWADYRLTDYAAIQRWWEIVCSVYLMVALQTLALHLTTNPALDDKPVARHPWRITGTGWKHTLNNLHLLIQPFISLCLLLPWLTVFSIPRLAQDLRHLIACINGCT